MRTTIDSEVDRSGDAHSEDDQNTILKNARKILADTSAYLELRIEALRKLEAGTEDAEEQTSLKKLMQETRAIWRSVLDIQMKAGAGAPAGATLDLEAARAEIEARLDRIAA